MPGVNSDKGNDKDMRQLPDDSAVARPGVSRRVQQDRALVDRCVSGDDAAWGELYGQYHGRLATMVSSLLGSRGPDDDLVGEIMARVWFSLQDSGAEILDRFDPKRGCQLYTYLGTITKSTAASYLRSERRRRRRERLVSRPESVDSVVPGLAPSELQELFAELTPCERQFLAGFLLRPANGKSQKVLSDANRWQLRRRIWKKLREFNRES